MWRNIGYGFPHSPSDRAHTLMSASFRGQTPRDLNDCREFCGGANPVARQLSYLHLQSVTLFTLLGELLISSFNRSVDIVELRLFNWLRERERDVLTFHAIVRAF